MRLGANATSSTFLAPTNAGTHGLTNLATDQADFSRILSIAEAPAEPTEPNFADQARDAAERLVAAVLVQPILKQLRETNRAAAPFAPTSGEKQFQSLMDAKLAQEITRNARFPLVEQLARDMRERAGIETDTTRRKDAPPTVNVEA